MVRLGHRNDLAQGLDHEHVIRIRIFLISGLVIDHLDRGVQQERSEDVEHIGPCLDDHCAQQNEQQTADQRDHNADEQHLLLICTRDLERTHDQREDEEVIHTQG